MVEVDGMGPRVGMTMLLGCQGRWFLLHVHDYFKECNRRATVDVPKMLGIEPRPVPCIRKNWLLR